MIKAGSLSDFLLFYAEKLFLTSAEGIYLLHAPHSLGF